MDRRGGKGKALGEGRRTASPPIRIVARDRRALRPEGLLSLKAIHKVFLGVSKIHGVRNAFYSAARNDDDEYRKPQIYISVSIK